MSRYPIPDTALAQHTAVLGKTGSGKTSTAKTIVEHLVAQGARVCILDPIKSDWWGLTSSVDGSRPGLPFHILGGPRGHVPLHAASGKAIAEIVANGTLPLSIIDMADFAPGGQAKFFIEFAPVMLRRMRGVVHLVMEEAHLFAPKERSGVGDENMAIHWAKMLATAGRSKGIRLILVTQRTQALHNAMLGSCETMVAHRLTAPADQKPLVDWLKANTAKDIVEQVSGSLSSLKTGTAWVCSGEAQFFEHIPFPRITTYDNSATPTGDMGAAEVQTAPVDVEKLRAIVGDAAREAEANDPKALKAEIARLTAQIKAGGAGISEAEKEAYRRVGHREGYEEGHRIGFARAIIAARDGINAINASQSIPPTAPAPSVTLLSPVVQVQPAPPLVSTASAKPINARTKPIPNPPGLSTPQTRVMRSLAFWKSIGHDMPTREQVAAVAGYRPGSGNFNNLIGGLSSAGHTVLPQPGRVSLVSQFEAMTQSEAAAKIWSVFENPQRRVVEAALKATGEIAREDLAQAAGYAAGSGNFNNIVGSLTTMDVLQRPGPGLLQTSDWAREVLSA